MQQYPVPQHISSYEFKLVGDMTLKQFFQLAGGALVALVFYASPLPGIVKWPFVVTFGLLGVALAFFPVKNRPLSGWIAAFIKAAYSPTLYIYKKGGAEEVFQSAVSSPTLTIITPLGGQKAEEYLSQTPISTVEEKFEKDEKNFFSKVSTLFHPNQQSIQNTVAPQHTATISPPPAVTTPSVPPQINQEPWLSTQSTAGVAGMAAPSNGRPVYAQVVDEHKPGATSVENIKVEPINQPIQQTTQAIRQDNVAYKDVQMESRDVSQTKQATFSPESAPPSPPDRPNTIIGQVLTSEGKIVEGAIMEIRDLFQKPVRAIKTNRVGHFLTVTPLKDGEYEIETEKEGLSFDAVRFKAEGRLIPPILIMAKATN